MGRQRAKRPSYLLHKANGSVLAYSSGPEERRETRRASLGRKKQQVRELLSVENPGQTNYIHSTAFSPDSRFLGTGD